VDGIIGDGTLAFIVAFQQDQGVTVTAELDEATFRALEIAVSQARVITLLTVSRRSSGNSRAGAPMARSWGVFGTLLARSWRSSVRCRCRQA